MSATARSNAENTNSELVMPAYEAVIYPNPVLRFINLEHSFVKGDEWKIVNAFGQIILKRTVNTANDFQAIDAQNLKSGVYYLAIHKEDGNTITKKIIKQ